MGDWARMDLSGEEGDACWRKFDPGLETGIKIGMSDGEDRVEESDGCSRSEAQSQFCDSLMFSP